MRFRLFLRASQSFHSFLELTVVSERAAAIDIQECFLIPLATNAFYVLGTQS